MPGKLQPFQTLDGRWMASSLPQKLQQLELMNKTHQVRLMVQGRVLGPEAITLKDRLTMEAGVMHVSNHLNWLIVANACDQVLVRDQRQRNTEGKVNLLLSEDPSGMDIARKFGALGIDATLCLMRKESWPEGVEGQALDTASIMTTGRLLATQ